MVRDGDEEGEKWALKMGWEGSEQNPLGGKAVAVYSGEVVKHPAMAAALKTQTGNRLEKMVKQ